MIPSCRSFFPVIAALAVATGGCNIGRTVDKMTLKRLAPGMLANGDVGMACASGGALSPPVIALGQRSGGAKEPRKTAALTLIAAGMCSEREVWRVGLARDRLLYMFKHGGSPSLGTAMQDLSIVGQRFDREAALRNLQAYERVVDVYGAANRDGACPSGLHHYDQLLYLLGMTAGLLAVIHDIQALHSVNVSMSIPPRVAEGARCFDDERWWGLPSAIEASVAVSIPGQSDAKVQSWAALEAAALRGEDSGVWLARALHVQALASTSSTPESLWRAIQAHGAALRRGPAAADSDYALLNAYASEMIRYQSDVLWIAATGSRTPIGMLGSRPPPPPGAERPGEDSVEEDDLLRGLNPDADEAAADTPPGRPADPSSKVAAPGAAPDSGASESPTSAGKNSLQTNH